MSETTEISDGSKLANSSLDPNEDETFPTAISNVPITTSSRSQMHFDNSNTMRGHHLNLHGGSISPPNLSHNLPHSLMPLGSDSSASYSSSPHLGSSQHLATEDNIHLTSETSNQHEMHRSSHEHLDNQRLTQSAFDLNSFQHVPNQHGHHQQQLQHQLQSFHHHQTSNPSLYNSAQGLSSNPSSGNVSTDFCGYGPMYQHYSNYLSLNKCRSNPYQRPSSNNSASATAQAVAAQAAAAAQYASSVFSSYPGFNPATGNMSNMESNSSAASASLAAALYPPRPHSYDYSSAGTSSASGSSLSGLPR